MSKLGFGLFNMISILNNIIYVDVCMLEKYTLYLQSIVFTKLNN